MTLTTRSVYDRGGQVTVAVLCRLAETAGMPVTHGQLFSIPVSDQDRSLHFCVDTLGFELVADTAVGPATSLTLVTWFPTMTPGTLKGTVLETDALEDDVAGRRDKGVHISAMEAAPWGHFVTFDDPYGNGIVLQETAPSS